MTFHEKLVEIELAMLDLNAELLVEHVDGRTQVMLLPATQARAIVARGEDAYEALGRLHAAVEEARAALAS